MFKHNYNLKAKLLSSFANIKLYFVQRLTLSDHG